MQMSIVVVKMRDRDGQFETSLHIQEEMSMDENLGIDPLCAESEIDTSLLNVSAPKLHQEHYTG